MTSLPDGIHKAAILLTALDGPVAQLLWSRLTSEQAESVRKAQTELGPVEPADERRVLDEFLRLGVMAPKPEPTGLELSTLAEKHRFAGGTSSAPGDLSGKPFASLHQVDGESLARALGAERAQTVAVVLAHLPASQAACVLQRLPSPLQKEVIYRLVDLEEPSPDILQEVEAVLRARLSQEISMPRHRVAGLATLSGILQATDPWTSDRILAHLGVLNPSLADRLRSGGPNHFRFDELIRMDAGSLRKLLSASDFEVVVLALTGADEALVDRVLEVIPQTDARVLQKRLSNPGPIRLRDVEEARTRLAALAEQMAHQGQIRLPAGFGRSEVSQAA